MDKKHNKTVSSSQIPERYRASRPKIVQLIGRWFLRIFNWKVEGQLPSLSGRENIVIIAGLTKATVADTIEDAKQAGRKRLELFLQNTPVRIPFDWIESDYPCAVSRKAVEDIEAELENAIESAKNNDLLQNAKIAQELIEPCKTALSDAGLSTSEINDVILVGGQTRMPKVVEEVKF